MGKMKTIQRNTRNMTPIDLTTRGEQGQSQVEALMSELSYLEADLRQVSPMAAFFLKLANAELAELRDVSWRLRRH